jgi:hypothetical protein
MEKPKREVVDTIIRALRLTEEEKNHLLLVGNYVPNDKEIEYICKITDPVIENWKYPVEVLDFTWRVVNENKVSENFYIAEKTLGKSVKKGKPNVLEIIFNPNFPLNKSGSQEDQAGWHAFLEYVVVQFQHAHRGRTREKFYTDLLGKMMTNPLFRDIWLKSQGAKIQGVAKNYGIKVFMNPKNPKKKLTFNFFIVPVLTDPRFDIEFHTPADRETFEYFEE